MDLYKDIAEKERSNRETDFLIKELRLDKNDKILDLACGSGRIANRIAKLGFNDVTGVDKNIESINLAKDIAIKSYIKVKYLNSDINEFYKYQNKFDKIFLIYCYFDYIKEIKVLHNIYNSLKIGGLFCLDLMNKNYPFSNFYSNDSLNNNADLNSQKVTNLYQNSDFERKTNYKNVELSEIVYDVFSITFRFEDITNLLRKIGFTIQAAFSDWNSSPFLKFKSKRIILIAKK